MAKNLLSIADFSAAAMIDPVCVYHLRKMKVITGKKIGFQYYFAPEDVLKARLYYDQLAGRKAQITIEKRQHYKERNRLRALRNRGEIAPYVPQFVAPPQKVIVSFATKKGELLEGVIIGGLEHTAVIRDKKGIIYPDILIENIRMEREEVSLLIYKSKSHYGQ